MKGGGMFNLFSNNDSDRIQTLKKLRSDITSDTTYGWLYPYAHKTNRLTTVDEALTDLRKNKRSVLYENVLNELIKNYGEREEDSKIKTDNSQQIANATNLLSRLYEYRIISKSWLEKYIEHLKSINSGLSTIDKIQAFLC